MERSLALLLSLAMVLTLLPITALTAMADGGTEQGTGVVSDVWVQDENTVLSEDSICEKTDDGLHLKAGSGNGNGKYLSLWRMAMWRKRLL